MDESSQESEIPTAFVVEEPTVPPPAHVTTEHQAIEEYEIDTFHISLIALPQSEDGEFLMVEVYDKFSGNKYQRKIHEKQVLSGEIYYGHHPPPLQNANGFIQFVCDGLNRASSDDTSPSDIECTCTLRGEKYSIEVKAESGSGWTKVSFGTLLEMPLTSTPSPLEKAAIQMEQMRLEMIAEKEKLYSHVQAQLDEQKQQMAELLSRNSLLESKTNYLETQNAEQKEALEEAKSAAKVLFHQGNAEMKAIMLTAMHMRVVKRNYPTKVTDRDFDALLAFLKSGNPTQKAQVAEILSKIGDQTKAEQKGFVGALVTLISDGEEDGRLFSVRTLRRFADNNDVKNKMKSSIQPIENCYNKEEVPAVRTAMEDLLSKIKG